MEPPSPLIYINESYSESSGPLFSMRNTPKAISSIDTGLARSFDMNEPELNYADIDDIITSLLSREYLLTKPDDDQVGENDVRTAGSDARLKYI
jgi:hypothetical protein